MEGDKDTMMDTDDKNINLLSYFNIVRNRLRLILFIVLTTFFIVAIKTFSMTPLYRAVAEILIEQNRPLSLFERDTRNPQLDPTFLPTQYEIIKSTSVVDTVINDLLLDTKYRDHFLGKQDAENAGILPNLLDKIRSIRKSIKQFIKNLIKKDDTSSEISMDAGKLPEEVSEERQEIAQIINKNLSIIPLSDTKIVRFIYVDKDPKMAALIANSFVEAYKNVLMEIKLANSNYSISWMKIKADEELKKLQELENQKQQYARENDIITLENRLAVLPQKLAEYSTRLTDAGNKQRQLQDINKLLESSGGNLDSLESIPLIANDPVLQNIQSQLVTLDREIAELSKKYGPKHPRMQEKANDRATLRRQKEREIKKITQSSLQEFQLAKKTEDDIQGLFEQTKSEALLLNEKLSVYEKMNRELETSQTLYDALLKNIKEANARMQEKDVNIWTVNQATPPEYPYKPNKKINLALALLLGMAGGIGFAFFLDYLDDTIKAPEDIERFKIPVLGIVEKVPGKEGQKNMLITEGSFSTLAESYKIIRSSVLLSSPESPPHTILITSMEPGDGKTTTTINFARSLSMLQSSRVLVIDCDLRKPRLHAKLHITVKREKSLSSYLAGITSSTSDIILKLEGLPFDIIPAGPVPPNPSELLSSTRMQALLPVLRKNYDFILLDSPPLFGAIDGLNLSTFVDGTIIVARANKTTKNFYGKVVKRLHSVNCRILGCIINGAEVKKSNLYHYAGYYASYGHYGDSHSSEEK